MGYRYIGAKTRIAKEIISCIENIAPKRGRVVDLMCGTGAISLELRKRGYKVTAVDVMHQACHTTKVNLFLQKAPDFEGARKYLLEEKQPSILTDSGYKSIINTLNNLKPIKGYFWKEFSPEGKPENGTVPRKYFTSYNAQKIDATIAFIKNLKEKAAITDIEHSLLIHDTIMAVNDIANIAGTYGHYLSKFVKRAEQPIKFKMTKFETGGDSEGHVVLQGHAEEISGQIEGDVCYIDPPYIKRQYAANYHILETIAKADNPLAAGKSGLRPWRDEYSDFCSKVKIRNAFEKIFKEMKCNDFLISYSSDGLLTKNQLLELFGKFGQVKVKEFLHKRFKSRNEDAKQHVVEYIFHLKTPN